MTTKVTAKISFPIYLMLISLTLSACAVESQERVLTSEKAQTELQVQLPTDQLVLSIAKDGTLALNREPVTRETLEERIKTALEGRREKTLFFDVDEEANYGFTVEVMDACRGSGVKVLGIMTKN